MTYPLLAEAPTDHNSEEFLAFLRQKNAVVWENDQWLVIENCKYHTQDSPWYTAFHKPLNDETEWWNDIDILDVKFCWEGYDMLVKAPERRSVQRFHVHLVKKPR